MTNILTLDIFKSRFKMHVISASIKQFVKKFCTSCLIEKNSKFYMVKIDINIISWCCWVLYVLQMLALRSSDASICLTTQDIFLFRSKSKIQKPNVSSKGLLFKALVLRIWIYSLQNFLLFSWFSTPNFLFCNCHNQIFKGYVLQFQFAIFKHYDFFPY